MNKIYLLEITYVRCTFGFCYDFFQIIGHVIRYRTLIIKFWYPSINLHVEQIFKNNVSTDNYYYYYLVQFEENTRSSGTRIEIVRTICRARSIVDFNIAHFTTLRLFTLSTFDYIFCMWIILFIVCWRHKKVRTFIN